MAISTKHQVAIIEYQVIDSQTQEVIDSTLGKKPLEFVLGAGHVIAGVEKALKNATIGQTLVVDIPPEESYGHYRTDYLQEVPRDQFEGIKLKKGMTLFGRGANQESVQVSVKDFSDKMVMLDYNHPLAGKTLTYHIKLLGFREALEQEVLPAPGDSKQCCGGGCGCKH
ncbi:peptidylprolyl isomerase [Helicobacter baculiformis]|uniref:Peptidyl-prolyl cis-trans isomerase n=1 Tax=Helicobacter baculiformis TaxID=427351 RepID=A0ABV7ZHA6_9HELI|nr:peptidylprolyl isomerase [Helicobacter baculiformis]